MKYTNSPMIVNISIIDYLISEYISMLIFDAVNVSTTCRIRLLPFGYEVLSNTHDLVIRIFKFFSYCDMD